MKNAKFILWGLIGLALVGIVVAKLLARGRAVAAPPQQEALFSTPAIALTDQNGKPFSTAKLRGHPWIADFIFTSCPGSCPVMSHELSQLQGKTPAGVDLVSFTVDPAHDTPAILKQYGQAFHADFSRWRFLTGTQQQMSDAAIAMKIAVRAADGHNALQHSTKFLLVDAAGSVVGIYEGTNAQDIARLTADATRLANGGKTP